MAESKISRDARSNRRRGEHRKAGKIRRDIKRREQKDRSRQRRAYSDKPICPYCGKASRKVEDSAELFGRDLGAVYVCEGFPKCDSYVYCHPSGMPLGTLANKDLRRARRRTHDILDKLWHSNRLLRRHVYEQLAAAMGLTRDECHIGKFDLGQCEEAAAFARRRLREIYGSK